MLAITGLLIYPIDQFGLRDMSIRSRWLPARYETNTWKSLLRALAVTPDGHMYAAHRYGIFVSQDAGQQWRDITENIPGDFHPDRDWFPPVLSQHPRNSTLIIASKGIGLALSRDGGVTWTAYGESDDEDLSHRGIQDITWHVAAATVGVIDDLGFVYQRLLDPERDEGWERLSVSLPYGEQRGVGIVDWQTIALYLHNGQLISERYWWVVNHSFSGALLLLAVTGLVLWWRHTSARNVYPKRTRTVPSKVLRILHHMAGLWSWPLLFLLPLTGVVLLHVLDVAVLRQHGLPARWLPSPLDHNRWKGPGRLHLRTLVSSPNTTTMFWLGHTYGLFVSEDAGQHWTEIGTTLSTSGNQPIEHLVVAPWWFDYLYIGNAQGLQVSRDQGRHWTSLLAQPVDALYADSETLYVVAQNTLYWQKFAWLITPASPQWHHTALAPPYGPQGSIRRTQMYQLLHDLHSGRVFAPWFRYVLDIVAGLMLLQTISGLVLWSLPRWRRWRRARTPTGRRWTTDGPAPQPATKRSVRLWSLLVLVCGASLVAVSTAIYAAAPVLPPAVLQPFVAAKQTGNLQQLLLVFHRTGQDDTPEAATAILYGGLSESILANLAPEPQQRVLASAQAALQQITDPQAKKVIYKAISSHPDWRVRAMLLDIAYPHAPTEPRAQRALIKALTDSTDAVALKAIDMVGELKLAQAVPTLMRLVITKWGQHVGVGAAKATLALEHITGTTKPEAWEEWINTHR
jgi:uncharacterized iron-regulated membrane protein